jgi:hypothetical protein
VTTRSIRKSGCQNTRLSKVPSRPTPWANSMCTRSRPAGPSIHAFSPKVHAAAGREGGRQRRRN